MSCYKLTNFRTKEYSEQKDFYITRIQRVDYIFDAISDEKGQKMLENSFIQSSIKVMYQQQNINDRFMGIDFFGSKINKNLSKQRLDPSRNI